MATAVATPAASFTSARDMMDSILSGPTVTEVIPQDAPPIDPDAPDETATSEIPDDEPLPDDESEVAPAEDDEEDEELDSIKDGKKYRVNATKMKRLLAASKLMKAASEHFEPTPEAVLEHYQAATNLSHMTRDFRSGDPDSISAFMDHWSGESPDGFATLAQNLPAFLAKKGMEAPLRAIETQVQNAIVSRAYSEAATAAAIPEQDRSVADKRKIFFAQELDHALRGLSGGEAKYKGEAEIAQLKNRPRAPQVDQREQRLNQQEKNLHDTHWNGFDTQYVSGPRETSLVSLIDEAFKPFEGKYGEKLLKALKATAKTDVQAEIDGRPEWKRNQELELSDIQREFRQALKTQKRTDLEPRIERVNSEYRNFIARKVPAVVKALTNTATKSVVDESQATHDRLARSARNTAPSAGGTAAPRAVKGQSYKDALDRVFA